MAKGRMSTGNNDEMDLESSSDLSIDNFTFDQHIITRSEPNSTGEGPRTEVLSHVRALDGQVLTPENYGTDNVGFIRFKREPTPDPGAYIANVLPVPALDCYAGTPPPSFKVGKFVKQPRFYSLSSRLQSFIDHNWELRKPSPAALANAGFYYRGTFQEDGKEITDQVYCYKCGESIRQWEKEDDPSNEHKRLHPLCLKETWVTDDRM